MTTHKTTCSRIGCANNEAGECRLDAPRLVRTLEVDAYTKCYDQVNA